MSFMGWIKRNYININFALGIFLCALTTLPKSAIVYTILQFYIIIELIIMIIVVIKKFFLKQKTFRFMDFLKTAIVLLFSVCIVLKFVYGININSKLFLLVSGIFCLVNFFIKDKN